MLIRHDAHNTNDANHDLSTELKSGAPASAGIRERVLALVQSRSGGLILAGVALLLCAPALRLGIFTDDHVLRSKSQLGWDWFSLFEITRAQAAHTRGLGILAWWSSPELTVNFLRPLSALTHLIEFHLYPDTGWAMHLTSNLIYAALVAIVWLLYRELLPNQPRVAALAALMFAIDDGHAASVGWISGRNTLLASLFVFAALLCHAHARKYASSPLVSRALGPQLRWHGASALCVALALLSAEAGVSVLAYLFAYALVFESGRLSQRLITLTPQAVVFLCWALLYVLGGFGAHGTSFYRDLADPFLVLGEGILDLPSWLLSLVGPSVISPTLALPPSPVRLAALVLCLPLLIGLALGVPRTRENIYFGLGALLCLPPLFTTLPQDRLLIAASFGAFGFIASFIGAAASNASRWVRGTRIALIGFHLVLAPLMFFALLPQSRPFESGAREVAAQVREHAPSQVVMLNTPIELISLYAWSLALENPGRGAPGSMHQLYSGSSPLEVTRIDATTLEVHAPKGWGEGTIERVFCALSDLPRTGTKLKLEAFAVSVVDSDSAGHPVRAQFKFLDALESPGRLWLVWQGKKPVPWQPPAVGQTVSLAPLSIFTSLEF
jgi:hypothetical protein